MDKSDKDSALKGRIGMVLKVVLFLTFALGLVAAGNYFNLQGLFHDALDWIDKAGAVGPLVFFGLYVAACVFMLPGLILTVGAGAVFGLVKGSLLVSLSSTAGAAAAFLVGRYLARGMVIKRVRGNKTFLALDQGVATEGWKIVGLARLSPVFPFNLLNYIFGLTRIPLKDYVLASWIGMLPGTVMYVYIGSLAGSIAGLGVKEGGRSTAEWALYLVGLIATVAVTIVITRIARRALGRRINHPADGKEE